MTVEALAPVCTHCHKRHLPSLRCWRGRYSTRLKGRVLAIKGRTCWLCGLPGADSIDHVIPRSRGGDDTDPNLMPAHVLCNVQRGNGPPPGHAARLVVLTGAADPEPWLREHADHELPDIVLTRDRLARALSVSDVAPSVVTLDDALSVVLNTTRKMTAPVTVYVHDPVPDDYRTSLYRQREAVYVDHDATRSDTTTTTTASALTPGSRSWLSNSP